MDIMFENFVMDTILRFAEWRLYYIHLCKTEHRLELTE